MDQDFDQGVELQNEKIYEIKCLFGATDIEFYEIFTRRVLQILFEVYKVKSGYSLILNIALPIKWKDWS